ncbi:protein PAL OF QUIRKY-like [Curcuma longa]|uniref:protein PAL OF QUIRKY-like n=1 Tax=Curcuma longa TaxID=136217 RepID=UPI003D9EEBF5
MVVSSSSYSASVGCVDDISARTTPSIKFLCSYGGKILPRRPDGRLRYVGGHTRVLSVPRSISFAELQVKLSQLCGWKTVSLRCQLPTEDMDALVSVTSDEDLANLVEEYTGRERTTPLKIRAFLFLPQSFPSSKSSAKTPTIPLAFVSRPSIAAPDRCPRQYSVPARFYARYEKPTASSAAARKLRLRGHYHLLGHGTTKPCNDLVHPLGHWH